MPHPFGLCSGSSGRIDIAANPGQTVNFSATSDVNAIQTQYITGQTCFDGSVPPPYNAGIHVWMWHWNGASWVYLGSVGYVHIDNPIADGYYYNWSGYDWNQSIGTVPYGNCGCACYTGPHTHVERCDGGVSVGETCCESMGEGTTWMYEF